MKWPPRRVQRAIYARIRQTAPHLRIAHILAYMCLRLRRGATQPPAKRSVHYRGHPTGGPSLRDGHSRLSHRIKENRERARKANGK